MQLKNCCVFMQVFYTEIQEIKKMTWLWGKIKVVGRPVGLTDHLVLNLFPFVIVSVNLPIFSAANTKFEVALDGIWFGLQQTSNAIDGGVLPSVWSDMITLTLDDIGVVKDD